MAKDKWEKADILAKAISAVGIGVITLYVTLSNNLFNQRRSNHELLEKLLADVADINNYSRRDISLHALNYLYQSGDVPDKPLYREVLRYVYTTTAGKTNESAVARRYLMDIGDKAYLDSFSEATLKAIPPSVTTSQQDSGLSQQVIDERTAQLSSAAKASEKGVVYIEFAGASCRDLIKGLKDDLVKKGWNVPAAESLAVTTMPETTQVRYYYAADALKAADLVKALQQAAPGKEVIKKELDPGSFKVQPPAGVLEIWFSTSFCP